MKLVTLTKKVLQLSVSSEIPDASSLSFVGSAGASGFPFDASQRIP